MFVNVFLGVSYGLPVSVLVCKGWKWEDLTYLYGRTVKIAFFKRLKFCCTVQDTEMQSVSD